MIKKIDLVLDIAGVIASNFSPIYWEDLSSKFEVTYEELIKFRKEVRDELWTGKITEQEFWERLIERFPTIDGSYAKKNYYLSLNPCLRLKNSYCGVCMQISTY
ncbi:hypothetical protein ACUIJN_23810 [Metabacillus halosaccharovorans]|uniref:hypothetical protein n=1 Tax=Metabacillus halosaccharovorans TaxID=930124 RepID=UPI00403E0C07